MANSNIILYCTADPVPWSNWKFSVALLRIENIRDAAHGIIVSHVTCELRQSSKFQAEGGHLSDDALSSGSLRHSISRPFWIPACHRHAVLSVEAGIYHIRNLDCLLQQPVVFALCQIIGSQKTSQISNGDLEKVELNRLWLEVNSGNSIDCFTEFFLHIHDPERVEIIHQRRSPTSERLQRFPRYWL
ncbi:unnamed protein product [Periconia digitata]|uniref:Uncharacterized protein n=1 Tax=Periconia digitata TaxID=1303443 RepID=A0A9W4XJA2_9PLEO|nr:unnamed protein product [Periconia digitata]